MARIYHLFSRDWCSSYWTPYLYHVYQKKAFWISVALRTVRLSAVSVNGHFSVSSNQDTSLLYTILLLFLHYQVCGQQRANCCIRKDLQNIYRKVIRSTRINLKYQNCQM